MQLTKDIKIFSLNIRGSFREIGKIFHQDGGENIVCYDIFKYYLFSICIVYSNGKIYFMTALI